MAMPRIGLFGGSFNPVHLGHLLVAQAALEEIGLDSVFFIPAAQSPFKTNEEIAPAVERVRLLRLALAGRTRFRLDAQEIERGGISYSIDTVENYARNFPGAELFYLIGADIVPQLPLWRASARLAQLVQFVVIPRPGENAAAAPAPFRTRPLRGFPLGVSSSEIRDRIRTGRPIDYLVPAAVSEAIANNRLYI